LRAGAVGLVALLALDLAWGARYWAPARDYVRAKRESAAGHWAEAAALLTGVLVKAPGSEPALLLKIKAELLKGDPAAAQADIQRFGDRKTKDPLIGEINAILPRVDRAFRKVEEARKFAERYQDKEALAAMEEAATAYPESAWVVAQRDVARANVAFYQGDYVRFTDEATKLHTSHPDDPEITLMLASGFAAQYAKTGDESLAALSRASLEQGLEQSNGEQRKQLLEYAEHIRYRLATREIISREEFARRKANGEIH
jgi:hypothetical protein